MREKEPGSVLVELSVKDSPEEVYFGFVKYRVREYVLKPTRSFKCQEFGHIAKVCKGKRRCARCGGDHEYGHRGGVQPKCCNHSVAFWGFEGMRHERDIQRIRGKEKVSCRGRKTVKAGKAGNGS